MIRVARVLGGVIAFIGAAFGSALLLGRRLHSGGQHRFDAAALTADGGRFTVTPHSMAAADATLAKPYMAWPFTVYHAGIVTFAPALPIRALTSGGRS
jgi:hypothetical protein